MVPAAAHDAQADGDSDAVPYLLLEQVWVGIQQTPSARDDGPDLRRVRIKLVWGPSLMFYAALVRVGTRANARTALAEAIRAHAGEVDEVSNREHADRVVTISPPDDGGWVVVEEQRILGEEQEPLGALVSRVCAGPALALRFGPDEVRSLDLYDRGHRVGAVDAADPALPEEGAVAQWASVFGVDADRLAAAESRAPVTPRALFAAMCDVLGCSASRVFEPTGDGHVLWFRERVRPRWEQPMVGPPSLSLPQPKAHENEVGNRLILPFTAHSTGGRGRGLRVRVSAVPAGVIELETIELKVVDPDTGAQCATPGSSAGLHSDSPPGMPLPTGSRDGGGETSVVTVPDWPIPAGLVDPSLNRGGPSAALVRAVAATWTTVVLHGTAQSAGEAAIELTLVPLENPEGATTVRQRCIIGPRLRRPLRMDPSPFAEWGDIHLRHLMGAGRLNALVVLDGTVASMVARTADWLELFDGREAEIFLLDRATGRMSEGRGPVDRTRLAAELINAERVVLTADGPRFAFFQVDGLGFLDVSSPDDLALRWSARIDAAMAEGRVLQASLYRTASDSPPSTPGVILYEAVVGIYLPEVTMSRSWCTRFVRVPGDLGLWLGPQLASGLDDAARRALDAIADCERVGDGLRVRLRDPAQMEALEAAIAELLPTVAQSREASFSPRP